MHLGNASLIHADDFTYLEGMLSSNATSDNDIERRVGLALVIVRSLDKVWQFKNICKEVKVRLHHTLVQYILLSQRKNVNFKTVLLKYKTLNELTSSYLSDMLIPVSMNPALRRNRSADRGDLAIPHVKNTSYGGCSSIIAGQTLWNTLPSELRHSSSVFF